MSHRHLSTTPVSEASTTGMMREPAVLLLITGILIGLNFPLGKLAGEAGVSPMIWALLISLGAVLVALPLLLASGQRVRPTRRVLRYAAISSLVSFVTPNLLLFSVIPHAGAGYTGLMFALSPVFTLLLASLFGLRTPRTLGRIGIAIGLLGAVLVSLTRSVEPAGPGAGWLLVALVIPIALALGNVYRTLDWPDEASPNLLAFWGHLFSSSVFIALLLLTRGTLPLAELIPAAGAALAQLLVAGMTFPAFFRLQRQGGPVLLSQIGYVAAAVSLVAATLFLGETYHPATWLGAAVIGVGIAITLIAQSSEN
jgi:drug/metabolite transporter (DMT)-like permease